MLTESGNFQNFRVQPVLPKMDKHMGLSDYSYAGERGKLEQGEKGKWPSVRLSLQKKIDNIWIGRLLRRCSIAKKFGYSYALAIAISGMGTMAGLAIGEYYENQALERLAIANEQEHLLDNLFHGVMGMRSHPQRLVPALGKTIGFDYERAKFHSHVNHFRARVAELASFIDNNPCELVEDETQLKELLQAYESNTELYIQLVNNLWKEIDPPNLRPEEIPAAQQTILVYLNGEIATKIDVKFDRLSENLTQLISTAETQHAQARTDQKKAKELRLSIVVVTMLLSAAIASFLALYTSRAIARPLERVTAIAQRVTTDGNFQLRATVTTDDEVASLAIALNQLIQWVGEYTYELEQSRDSLEQRVQSRTQELTQALRSLKATQSQLIQTEKMSSLGQMVAGIAHEINNPVSFIYGNIEYAKEYTEELLNLLELYQQEYPEQTEAIQDKIAASEVEYMVEDLPQLLNSMKTGADRIKKIVLSLRNFSRLDESEMKAADINEGIDNTLLILNNRMHERIAVNKDYGNLPPVTCYPAQLNQVFLNIIENAIEALLDSSGTKNPQIDIRTEKRGDRHVRVRISDNGPGITEEVREKLFDPFFTTKEVGKGTGMGLAIAYQIVEKHRGKIEVISEPGKGAEFAMVIPIHSQEPEDRQGNVI